jgi:SAM-dependent methyltransferase
MDYSPRYTNEILAWEYDQRNNSLSSGELEWYLKYAAQAKGNILELACGSGRLLIPIAEAGYQIDGVDNAEAMLSRLRSKLFSLGRHTQSKAKLYLGDMLTFKAPYVYKMVFVGYNSLTCLETEEMILQCFRNVSSNLEKEGFFLFMIRLTDPTKFADGKKHLVIDRLDKPYVNAQTGFSVGVKLVFSLDLGSSHRVDGQTFVITDPSGKTETIEVTNHVPILTIDEYKSMLELTGFKYKVHKGYEEKPEKYPGEYVCFVCRKL